MCVFLDLEKLYLVLKKEDEARVKAEQKEQEKKDEPTAINIDESVSSVAAAAVPVATPAVVSSPPPPSNNVTLLPPPPLSAVRIALADGFSKYALIGQPGGDNSAAHEAGYDAYMTAFIFAHFVAEAPHSQLLTPLRTTDTLSIWQNRVPLYRHLMALNLNCTADGEPGVDELVDIKSTIYIMRAFPAEWKTEDVLGIFEEKYANSKRKLDEQAANAAAAATNSNATVTAACVAGDSNSRSRSRSRLDRNDLFIKICRASNGENKYW